MKTKRRPTLNYTVTEFIHFIAAHFADFGREIGQDEHAEGGDILPEVEFQDLVLEELERITIKVKR